jgi:tetratricopeptide (TPR) repeat protein
MGVIRQGIDSLRSNPWNVTVLRSMAEACAGLHYNEVELVYLKQALVAAPEDIQVNRHCALSLGRMGQFDQAIACWHRVERLTGNDAQAAQMISRLAEEKLKYPGGRPPMPHRPHCEPKQTEPKKTSLTEVLTAKQRLELAIETDRRNPTHYLDLVELLVAERRYNEAQRVLTQAMEICGEETALAKRLEDVKSLSLQRMLTVGASAAVNDEIPNPIPWLELTTCTVLLTFLIQLIPSMRAAAWDIIDLRHWTRVGWLSFSCFTLLALLVIRFSPEVHQIIRRKRSRRKNQLPARVY